MTRLVFLVMLIGLVACGGSDNPVAPSTPTPPPVPTATLEAFGTLTFTDTFPLLPNSIASVSYEGGARNLGPDCAENIRGLTRLFNATSEVDRNNWTFPLRVRPNETFLYEACCILRSVRDVATSYTTELSWDRVFC